MSRRTTAACSRPTATWCSRAPPTGASSRTARPTAPSCGSRPPAPRSWPGPSRTSSTARSTSRSPRAGAAASRSRPGPPRSRRTYAARDACWRLRSIATGRSRPRRPRRVRSPRRPSRSTRRPSSSSRVASSTPAGACRVTDRSRSAAARSRTCATLRPRPTRTSPTSCSAARAPTAACRRSAICSAPTMRVRSRPTFWSSRAMRRAPRSERSMSQRPDPETAEGVVLPRGQMPSGLLHELLSGARDGGLDPVVSARILGSAETFRTAFPRALPRFEATRLASPRRAQLAASIVRASRSALRLRENGVERPLDEALAQRGEALPLELRAPRGATRLQPYVGLRGKLYKGRDLKHFSDQLRARGSISSAAARALVWLSEQPELDLSGRRFALLGAAAELAPVRLLLQGGADVLWIDVQPPPAELLADPAPRGRLLVPMTPADLLRRPREIAATLARCAEAGPLDLGLYAYAPGHGREWRLTAAMNAIVESLDPGSVRSLTLLVSPTSPIALEASDLTAAAQRRATRPAWQTLLDTSGLLGSGAHARSGSAVVMQAVVGMQGASYQAAQYVEKILTAETWAAAGYRVSANVAGVTRTRSMQHPVFEAAFDGAPALGVEIYRPETTRALSGLMALHDLLQGERASAPLAQRVHGGLHVLPYAIEPALRVAAALGFARHPFRLFRLLRHRAV